MEKSFTEPRLEWATQCWRILEGDIQVEKQFEWAGKAKFGKGCEIAPVFAIF